LKGFRVQPLHSYAGLVGEFVKFSETIGGVSPQLVTAAHIREFLQEKQKNLPRCLDTNLL